MVHLETCYNILFKFNILASDIPLLTKLTGGGGSARGVGEAVVMWLCVRRKEEKREKGMQVSL